LPEDGGRIQSPKRVLNKKKQDDGHCPKNTINVFKNISSAMTNLV
jgi:hypothetical protein